MTTIPLIPCFFFSFQIWFPSNWERHKHNLAVHFMDNNHFLFFFSELWFCTQWFHLDAGTSRQVQGFFLMSWVSPIHVFVLLCCWLKRSWPITKYLVSQIYFFLQEYSTRIINKLCGFILYDQNCMIAYVTKYM